MGLHINLSGAPVMASPWRRRRMCILTAEGPVPALLSGITATGATLETNSRPCPGTSIELNHPDAGTIRGSVNSVSAEGIKVAFVLSEASVAFALAAITADMSRPA